MKLLNGIFLKRASAGLLTGAANGLFGGGGGMVAVPLMRGVLNYDEKRAHATAILVIAPVCAASALVYAINGYAISNVVIPVALGSVAGGVIGAALLNKLPAWLINLIFISAMVFAGFKMLF